MTCRCNHSNRGPFESAATHEQQLESSNPGTGSSWTTYQRAEDYYKNQTKVRELNDNNFWNIFYDRNKVLVVDFWATWCPPCDDVAKVMVSLASRYSSGPYARLVKFYHVQLDDRINPKLAVRFGFPYLPVIYIYYSATGRPPTKAAPLLEGSLAGGELGSQLQEKMHDPAEYIQRIGTILSRHGHIPSSGSARTARLAESELLAFQDPAVCQQLINRYCDSLFRLYALRKDIENKKYQLDTAEFWSNRWRCRNLPPALRKNQKVVKTCREQIAKTERIRTELSAAEQLTAEIEQKVPEFLREARSACPNQSMPC